MKILVCDDEEPRGALILQAIEESNPKAEISSALGPALKTLLDNLFDRVDACLRDPAGWVRGPDLAFDSADIVILDNNLAHLGIKGARLTAEAIAGYVRAFTNAPYVVSVNKNPNVDFDLRYLVGDYATQADLALNTSHLRNRALWTSNVHDAMDGFFPSYWPCLNTVANRRRAQIDFVRAHLDDGVFESLAIPKDAHGYLSLHARGALYPDAEVDDSDARGGKRLGDVTFRDVFMARDRSIPAGEDRTKLCNAGNAENGHVLEILSRVIADVIDLWIRRDVLGPQEALVDVPHLLTRMPFLLGEGVKSADDWNKTVRAPAPPYGLDLALYEKHLASRKFRHEMWAPSSCFWWAEIKNDERLNALFAKAKPEEWLDVIFCEDLSIFVDSRTPGVSEFSAEFEGAWGRRHVARLNNYRYLPLSRFAV